jgi:putative transposase
LLNILGVYSPPVGAEATLAGVELCSMLKQGQMIDSEDKTVWEQFYSLAA